MYLIIIISLLGSVAWVFIALRCFVTLWKETVLIVVIHNRHFEEDVKIQKILDLRLTAKSLQSCPTLCDPIDSSPPGSPIPGILQARTLEWVAISFSNAWKWKVKVKSLSRVRLYRPHGLQPTRLFRPWDFPGKNTGVGCHCLLRRPAQIPSDGEDCCVLRTGSQLNPNAFNCSNSFKIKGALMSMILK